MLISEMTASDVAEFIRIDEPSEVELKEVGMLMESATKFIMNYTGRAETYVEAQTDFTYVWLVLIGEMFEKRQRQLDKSSVQNQTFIDILNMHSINMLPQESEVTNA